MRVPFVCMFGVCRCAKRSHKVKSGKMLLYFFASWRLVLRSRSRVGSTLIHHIAAMFALAGRQQSEYAVPAAIKGHVRISYLFIYLYIFYLYPLSSPLALALALPLSLSLYLYFYLSISLSVYLFSIFLSFFPFLTGFDISFCLCTWVPLNADRYRLSGLIICFTPQNHPARYYSFRFCDFTILHLAVNALARRVPYYNRSRTDVHWMGTMV